MRFKNKFLEFSFIFFLITTSLLIVINYNFSTGANDITNKRNILSSVSISPIVINGNDELDAHPNVTGSGTWGDPYRIEDFEIMKDYPLTGIAIDIKNTNKPLIIENCTIDRYYYPIRLDNVSNVIINNNTLLTNYYGIFHSYSENTTITNNFMMNLYDYGIRLDYLQNCTVLNNTMVSGGGILTSSYQSYYATHIIDHSNKVNGKTIYWFRDQIELDINNYDSNDVGQMIFINCSESIISNLKISNVVYGIDLRYSKNNTITNCVLLDSCRIGINLMASNNNTIRDNIISDCDSTGVHIFSSEDIKVLNNTISNCEYSSGLSLIYVTHSLIYNNTISNNEYGIRCYYDTENNTIYQNYFIGNDINAYNDDGIYNYWYYGSVGNYWDDYTGSDIDNDGIGDSPYTISGTSNEQDLYPIWDDGPTITILSPNDNDKIGSNAPSFIVYIADPQLDTIWYKINGANINFFSTNFTIEQSLWDSLSDGIIIIIIYANDTQGNIATESINIIKDTSNDNTTPNYPFIFLLPIILVSILSIILYQRRKNNF